IAVTWRSAQLWQGQPGSVAPIDLPQAGVSNGTENVPMVPHVAWRTFDAPDGSHVIVHQRAVDGPVENPHLNAANAPTVNVSTNGAYASGAVQCSTPVVRSSLTVLPPSGVANPVPRFAEIPGVLPVDAAVSPDSSELAVALLGSSFVERMPLHG